VVQVVATPSCWIQIECAVPADEHLLKMVQERLLIADAMDELVSRLLFHELLEVSASQLSRDSDGQRPWNVP
jgi:hypothetical protein